MKIEESATGPAIQPIVISPLCWWDKISMLQIVLSYNDMKLLNTLRHSHHFCYQCLAGKATPRSDNFSLKFSLKDDSDRKNVSTLLYTVCIQITGHALLLILAWFRFYIPVDFGSNTLFPHIVSVVHHISIEPSWFSLVIHDSPLTEKKSMPTRWDTRIYWFDSTSFTQSAYALPKKRTPNLKHLKKKIL